MPRPADPEIEKHNRKIRELMTRIYDPAAGEPDATLIKELADEKRLVADRSKREPSAAAESAASPTKVAGMMLGPDTTKLNVETAIKLQPVPTGIYHLLDPDVHPLLTVTVTNLSDEPRRVCVTAFIEGISAKAVRTVEFKRTDRHQPRPISLLPSLLPEPARLITEIQRATVHVIVEIFGSTVDAHTRTNVWSTLTESHDTFSLMLLSRNSGFNAVEDPQTGQVQDLTRYYGAWVTPNVEAVQALVRLAADRAPDRRIAGYQGRSNPEATSAQVRALFETLRDAGITYVNSVIDFGAGRGQITQRTRLPAESLRHKSANCIDGTVLVASLLEAASLHPAIVLIPGHAFVAWETGDGNDDWDYLETTMIANQPFEAARDRARSLFAKFSADDLPGPDGPLLRLLKLNDLRAAGIWPME